MAPFDNFGVSVGVSARVERRGVTVRLKLLLVVGIVIFEVEAATFALSFAFKIALAVENHNFKKK